MSITRLIGEGSLLIEADIRRSIIGRNVRIEAGAQIEDSVIFDHTHIGSGARLHRVIVDRQNEIRAGVEVGSGEEGAEFCNRVDEFRSDGPAQTGPAAPGA